MRKLLTKIKGKIDDIRCKCPKECDCENPPPDDGTRPEGVYHVSNECPIHNIVPYPNDECPVHGSGLTVVDRVHQKLDAIRFRKAIRYYNDHKETYKNHG